MCYRLDMEENASKPGGRQLQGQENQLDRVTRELVFQHSGLCQCGMPYRDPGPLRVWERKNGQVHLKIIAGEAMHPEKGHLVELGLPHGAKPRLILAHLNAEALRTWSPEIEVEATLTAFVRRIQGRSPTGPEIRLFKDQLARLSAASFRLGLIGEGRAVTVNTQIVTAFDLWFPKDARQRVLWPSTVRLSLDYFESLQRHAVPLHERALAALARNPMALDVYAWLAQRLHRIPVGRPQFVPWAALKDQFGWYYGRMANFRRDFLITLRLVLDQYPGAKLEVGERGLTLRHSLPPVLCRHSPIISGSKSPR